MLYDFQILNIKCFSERVKPFTQPLNHLEPSHSHQQKALPYVFNIVSVLVKKNKYFEGNSNDKENAESTEKLANTPPC